MRLVITDLTDMNAGHHCVAGWDLDERRMIRPLPYGDNWTTAQIAQCGIKTGATFEFQPTGKPHSGGFPHSSEDTGVHAKPVQRAQAEAFDWFGDEKPAVSASIAAIFDGRLSSTNRYDGMLQGCHVATGERLKSLGAIELTADSVCLFEDNFQGSRRLKARINDGSDIYSVSVSCHRLKAAYAEGGVDAAKLQLPKTKLLHIRLGVARPFPDAPNRCNLMLNGIHG